MGIVAITHLPSPRMSDALRTFIDVAPIDLALAGRQHEAYRAMLERAGARVVVLDPNLAHADAVFVEDTAIVLDEIAVLTSMGAPSRRDEPRGIEPELRRHRAELVRVEAPATIEGGDVLRVGRTVLVGATGRTNAAGMDALDAVLRRFGYVLRRVRVDGCLHLKTACTALPDGRLLANRRWVDARDLEGFALVEVADEEPDAANVALVNGRVLAASAHPRTLERLGGLGFDVDAVDLSEFAKAEGCVTCLSILLEAEK
ncbi:MAG TPA: arginine deiminase family protein [Labilithrix sp.]|nr:arginine deiminase family protein [Labilithrix sp.]